MKNIRIFHENGSYAMDAPDWCDPVVLAAGIGQVYTVPANCNFVFFSASGEFYARHNAPAAVPLVTGDDGTGSVYSPTCWKVRPGDTIGLVAPSNATVTIACYRT